MKIHSFKIEHLSNPIGIDVQYPNFMWSIDSCEYQTAYEIKVYRNDKCIWNSTKVKNNQTYGIIYEGEKLYSRDRCHVELKVWDEKNIATLYEEPIYFEMGLLNSSEWDANWISNFSAIENRNALYLRSNFKIEGEILKARLYCSALGIYTSYLNGQKVSNELLTPGSTNYHQRIQYQVYDVKKYLSEGQNVIGAVVGDGWFSPL